ncbi:Genomic island protein [Novosphingobium resinovorum]|jgi:putative DNA primase/helicase|uniref:Genomic island protein n=1 Tax=Novosphingobium resinovorum TaxID=158500 RepID=A0A031JEK0_9SPHN|nr:toprim domain-containing protein [Novosphingobium resinovorum]EZP71155.1 Genomic island protein [Novosphingobium resinovorum]
MPPLDKVHQLERRARTIVESLQGTWSRGKGMCCCPAHDDRTPSLSVTLGRKAILFHCFAGCSNEEVIAALDRQGVRGRDLFDGSGAVAADRLEKRTFNSNARRLWHSATAISDGPAEGYLAQRGILRASDQLRYLERTPLGPRGAVQFLPAMLAAVTTDIGIIAIHRTFLDAPNAKLAGFDRPKRALGSLGCGAVRLAPPAAGRLGLAEGIESALSATQMFGVPCWATLGNERFGLVAIPESVRELHLFIDNDRGGELAESRALKAYSAPGRVIQSRAPASAGFDWNDELKARLARKT